MRKDPTASIHSAARARVRSRRRSKVRGAFLTLVGLAMIGVGGWWAVTTDLATPEPTPTQTTVPGDPGAPSTPAPVEQWGHLYLDGWSMATLNGQDLTARVGGQDVTVTFTAMTADEIADLAARSPDVVERALARQVTDAVDLECTATGCRDGAGPIDVSVLTLDGPDTAHLRALGVIAGLWHAQVPLGPGSVTIEAQGWRPVTLPPTNRWLISAGLGSLFVTDPGWVGTAPRTATPGDLSATPVTGQHVAAAAPSVVAVQGLGQDLADAGSWTSSQLTLATSPTTGCVAGVLCYPGILPVTAANVTRSFHTVVAGDVTAGLALDDRWVTVTLPGALRQADAGELPPGEVTLRMVTASLHSGTPAVEVARAGLISTSENGEITVDTVLANVTFGGLTWNLAP